MGLALGLAALFIGADLVISGVTKRPISRLLVGYWDQPGAPTKGAPSKTLKPANAMTGGVHAPPSFKI